ncbi:DUF3037 domain-containing protein [Fulvivirga maritima]|uniref:DUF3037 domain-containing protein n=1 Tax=Fulvivirga maritima TaxID=2904247 RepID=UPI001F2685C9|nr:DUF3037 domain-containing protein [Fulvivirga maritima]UII25381.1 DUF3037 domain-containing protein [Fulvivirga maritima]
MQDYHLYEYATLRLMPRVERGEFVNIGTILYCKAHKFLECRFHWDEGRIKAIFPETDLELVKKYAMAIEEVCAGGKRGGAIGELTIAERFRWITATRSTILQASPVHPAFCKEAEATLERLHSELVL